MLSKCFTLNTSRSKYFLDACWVGAHGAICGIVARNVSLEMRVMSNEARQNVCWDKIKDKITNVSLEMEVLFLESEDVLEMKIK